MQGPGTSFQDISVRRRVLITVGIFTVMTTVIGLFGLLAIMDTSDRLHRTVLEGQEWIKTVDAGRQAQVHFKKQVQEWKDILLRGNDRHLFERHMRAFEEEERQVNEQLQFLSNRTASLGLTIPEIAEAIAVHRQLGHKYRDALAHYDHSRQQSAVLVDGLVRGIDRDPTDKIDAIVASLKVQAGNRLNAAEKMAMTQLEAYRGFSVFLIFLVLASIGFGIYNARSIIRELPPERAENDRGPEKT